MISKQKRRPQMRQVIVKNIEQVTPRVRRFTLGGEALKGFPIPQPGAHIKLIFSSDPQAANDPKKMRSQMRTYTPRQFNPKTNELTVEFVLHGNGLASTWAAQAEVGSALTVAGPGGGMVIPDTLSNIVMLVDESAIPAAGMVLDSLPEQINPIIVCEVEDAQEERSLSALRQTSPIWLHRQEEEASPGKLLEQHLPRVLESVHNLDDTFWWIACEANTMRTIRAQLLQAGINKGRLISHGYWKAGSSNHPDHDYGDN